MASIGPALPPHLLAKRKRQAEEEQDVGSGKLDDEASRSTTPPPPTTAHGASISPTSSQDDGSTSKRRRVLGPAPPPAPLESMPASMPSPPERTATSEDRPGPGPESESGSGSDSDSDDEYGPAPPTATNAALPSTTAATSSWPIEDSNSASKASKRDDWMLVPPSHAEVSQRAFDPSKHRARGFNTGRSARGGAGGAKGEVSAMWTETPEQKRRRLEDQVLGKTSGAGAEGAPGTAPGASAYDDDKARRIKEHNDKYRAKSLYAQHQEDKQKDRESGGAKKGKEEDDPSKRGFDYEKDMAGGSKIGHAQRKDMLNRAADFGSRFASGRFL